MIPPVGRYYGEPLVGEELVEGAITGVLELTTDPDGVLKGYSPIC